MGIEVRALAAKCNIGCVYCYQRSERQAQPKAAGYDLDRIRNTLEREQQPFGLFGGEPLLLPIADLETLWAWGAERFGRNRIQTNGTLVTDEHMALFRRYNVDVGISIDGPGALNDPRQAGNRSRTRETTTRVEQTIQRLCREHRPPSLIVTLHRANAGPEKLSTLCAWLRELCDLGVRTIRVHLLEVDDPELRATLALSTSENVAALCAIRRAVELVPRVRLDLFDDLRQLLLGNDTAAACTWVGCDPYTTAAVQSVEGDGTLGNCGRTRKDGALFAKSDRPGYERYLALYQTPQDAGGCRGCRFFLACKGQCPGTALDGDWRNRSEHCGVWMALCEQIERELQAEGIEPISLCERRSQLEEAMLRAWSVGENPSLLRIVGLIMPEYLLRHGRTVTR